MKPRTCIILICVCISFMALIVLCKCAGTGPQDSALKAAQISKMTYDELKPMLAQAIISLKQQAEVRPLTSDELQKDAKLKVLAIIMEDYRQAHNIYCKTLDLMMNLQKMKNRTSDDTLRLVSAERAVESQKKDLKEILLQIVDLACSLHFPLSPVTMP